MIASSARREPEGRIQRFDLVPIESATIDR